MQFHQAIIRANKRSAALVSTPSDADNGADDAEVAADVDEGRAVVARSNDDDDDENDEDDDVEEEEHGKNKNKDEDDGFGFDFDAVAATADDEDAPSLSHKRGRHESTTTIETLATTSGGRLTKRARRAMAAHGRGEVWGCQMGLGVR